jgi:cysteine desulfurase
MSRAEIYLDNNATTRAPLGVQRAMVAAMREEFGNPSSAHRGGDRGREALARSREQVAGLLGVDPAAVIFTSGGTEANNLVLNSVVLSASPCRLLTTSVEHSSIIKHSEVLSGRGATVQEVAVRPNGLIDLQHLADRLHTQPAVVSIQWVNNETGVIQPIKEIAEICRESGAVLHTDACQAVGKLEIDLEQIPVDFLTLSAHKFHGPQGVGAVIARNFSGLKPLLHGGPQEGGLRAGTENVPGIVGMGEAAGIRRASFTESTDQMRNLRDFFESLVHELVSDVRVNGSSDHRICNTSNLCFPGIDGQALVARLDLEGVLCSQSSACTNSRPEPSYVLRAMGLTEDEAYSSVRFSFSVQNTRDEARRAAHSVAETCEGIRLFDQRNAKERAARA